MVSWNRRVFRIMNAYDVLGALSPRPVTGHPPLPDMEDAVLEKMLRPNTRRKPTAYEEWLAKGAALQKLMRQSPIEAS